MSTFVYLSNEASDVSGYLKAYIGERSPAASATVSTAVTNTAVITTTTVVMTLTAGGSTAKWITPILQAAVTINTMPLVNVWIKESNASANGQAAFIFKQFTGGAEQTAFLTTSIGTEVTTSIARNAWVGGTTGFAAFPNTEVVTSTAFAAGDRIVIQPAIANAGGMITGQTLTMDYNGLTAGADGDTWVMFDQDFRAGAAQLGSGTSAPVKGYGLSAYFDLADRVQAAVNAGLITGSASANAIIDEGTYQKANV